MVKQAAIQGFDSLYLSLEEHPTSTVKKATIFGWDRHLYLPASPPSLDTDIDAHFVNTLKEARSRVRDANKTAAADVGNLIIPGAVIVGSLLPRPITTTQDRSQQFFLDQYRYIETLVRCASRHQSTAEDRYGIRIVVVDSLSMLTYSGQTRESLFRVFDLFRANGIMGVFTVDADSIGSMDDGNGMVPFDSTMADVVFSFSSKLDSAYLVHYISVEKSRYTPTCYGRHPCKIDPPEGVRVLPSLHAVIAATQQHTPTKSKENTPTTPNEETHAVPKEAFPFGWGDSLTKYVVRSSLKRPGVVALHGPHGTRKSTMAASFLLHGLVGYNDSYFRELHNTETLHPNESGILIRLRDLGEDITFSTLQSYEQMDFQRQHDLAPCADDDPILLSIKTYVGAVKVAEGANVTGGGTSKASIALWASKGNSEGPVLVVIDFNTGMLLPEEFVDIVLRVCELLENINKKVRRVAFDDVSVIGVSYPLLEKSLTTADLFLSAFVHVMRNQNVDLMLVGTRGQLDSANKIVDQAIALADAVVETKIRDIFGDRYILLDGDGAMAEEATYQECVPPALQLIERKDGITMSRRKSTETLKCMTFDRDLLRGLTGFDGAVISRTKVYAYLFEKNNAIDREYNRTLPYLLEPLCGLPEKRGASGLKVIPFGSNFSDTFHRSLDVVPLAPPKEHTALASIDEFELLDKVSRQDVDRTASNPYVNNVLFIAWRKDRFGDRNPKEPFESWSKLLEFATKPEEMSVCVDRMATETLSCCLVDCLFSGLRAAGRLEKLNFKDGTMRAREEIIWEDILKVLGAKDGRKKELYSMVAEARAMHKFLRRARSASQKRKGGTEATSDNRAPRDCLPDDAALYICWYSQLRHLLSKSENTILAENLRVAALPGKGFTGDWKLVVLPGSVSHGLGGDVVRELTKPDEDYRRFSLGVGLPVGKKWKSSEFRAWPGANEAVPLKHVYEIHGLANRRSLIPNYAKITRSLWIFARRLAGDWDEAEIGKEAIKEHLCRLPAHIETLVQVEP